MIKRLIAIAAAILLVSCSDVPTGPLYDLTVDYMTEPVGIDNPAPRFAWKMSGDHYGACQKAYRLVVVKEGGNVPVYSSSRVESDLSVGILYAGATLEPCTKYEWYVTVWDDQGAELKASSTFETGLMGTGWSDAKWISSGQPHFSKYRASFNIEFDIEVPEDSYTGSFIFGYQDDDNYVSVDLLQAQTSAILAFKHKTDGKTTYDADVKVCDSNQEVFHAKHHVCLKVVCLDYAKGYNVNVVFDDQPCGETVHIQPYELDVWKPYCRFNRIGFNQGEGESATFSNIKVSEDVWGTTLYSSDAVYEEKGGQMHIISPAEESGAPMFRKQFEPRGAIVSARLYTTARGIYEYYINGQRMSNDFFNPGSTDYRYRILYNTYDITPLLNDTMNVIGVQLGAGWYCDFTGFATAWQDQFGNETSLLAKIVVNYDDGTTQTIVSDDTWKVYNQGPITSDSLQNGEDYDARKELDGWSEASFDDSAWTAAIVASAPADDVEIQYYIGSPIQNNITLQALSVAEPKPGVFVYDMGQNMVGIPRIKLPALKEGQEITFKYGEMIYPNEVPEDPMPPLTAELYAERKGLAYNENYRGALSTDHYIARGGADEVFQPHFTFHGYRYVEIHGLDAALPLSSVEGLVLASVGAQTSGFETSDENVNQLYSNIVWGQRGNFLSIPTDCPQRDERMGWMGDAQVFARTATYNMNVEPFFSRWFYSIRDIQGDNGSYFDYVPKVGIPPKGSHKGGGSLGWMEAGVVIPWQLYLQYADKRFLEEHYDSMVAYLDYLQNRAVGYIQPGSGYGDWVAVEHTNSPLTNTAYFGYDALLMIKMAKALGRDDDVKRFTALYGLIKNAFNREFVGEDAITKESKHVPPYVEWIAGGSDATFKANTQTSYVVPLQADLFNEVNKPLAVKHLADNVADHGYCLTTGFIGTPYINLVLSANGEDETAYRLFEQTEYPSWLYPVLQGATTMWERWNSYTIKRGFGMVDMNSFNHYSFGAVQEWMMSYMLGIQPVEEDPGYHSFILSPRTGGSFSYAKGHYESIYGRIESGWEKTDSGYRYTFTVPANTSAVLQLPAGEYEFTKGSEFAQAVPDQATQWHLVAGEYVVEGR